MKGYVIIVLSSIGRKWNKVVRFACFKCECNDDVIVGVIPLKLVSMEILSIMVNND